MCNAGLVFIISFEKDISSAFTNPPRYQHCRFCAVLEHYRVIDVSCAAEAFVSIDFINRFVFADQYRRTKQNSCFQILDNFGCKNGLGNRMLRSKREMKM